MLAVPSAVDSAAVTANMSARRPISKKQGVGTTSSRHRERAEVVDADGDAGPSWQGRRDGGPPDRLPRRFSYFKQLCNHHRVQMFVPVHHWKLSSIRRVRAVPRWQEAEEWQACMTQGRMSNGT